MILHPGTKSATSDSWVELRRAALRSTLAKHVQGEVRFDPADRALYSTDASIYQIEPMGVVIPKTTEALAAAVAIAMEQQVPIIPRGGGTSLSGQAIGAGLIIDCSKYLDRVVDLDLEARTVRVQPGCVLGQLNRRLRPLGYLFGPDVATIDRANLGGMIGNNSAGARSIRFGKTVDNVVSLDVVLTDGNSAKFHRLDAAEARGKQRLLNREGEVYRAIDAILTEESDEIARRFPKVFRRVSGYNLDALLPPADLNLAKLIVGSEGTLATVTEATLTIVPIYKFRAVAVLEFSSVADALASVPALLTTRPSAVELIDEMILNLARASPEYRKDLDFIVGTPKAILIVEYLADEPGEVERSLVDMDEAIAGRRLENQSRTSDAGRCERIWNVRKMSLPLLLSLPGSRTPVTFVEDTAVSPDRLGEFVSRFREVLTRHGTDGSFYGHASVGCLHIRPLLDLTTAEGVATMRAISEEIFDLVMAFGGALSGEHGDGLARSCFNPALFGPRVYAAFRRVKQVFDPLHLMNPGKIVDAPPMTEHLRQRSTPAPSASGYSYADAAGPLAVVRACNGNGLCRRQHIGVMCPSYVATRDEQHSPRGRANLLREVVEGRVAAEDGLADWTSPAVAESLDLCLGCKACKNECPSSVDIAQLKSEHLYRRHQVEQPALVDRLTAQFSQWAWWGSRFAPLSNLVMRNWLVRRWLYPALGIDPRRRLPVFHRSTLSDWFRQHKFVGKESLGEVVLLGDCFTEWHDPQVGRAAVMLLELAGYQVHLATLCCGRTLISKGFLDEARELARRGVRKLIDYAEAGVPILGLEPSCILTLADEWLDLDTTGQAGLIAGQVGFVDGWLEEQFRAGLAPLPKSDQQPIDVLVHGHCHQRAAGRLEATVRSLETLAGVKARVIDSGCCGMAGSFGYEKGHFEISLDIAEQRLLPAIREAPQATIVAPGFSCRSQIRDFSGRVALHPVELIRRRLGVHPPKRFARPASRRGAS
jgi:FAD/FMN-containing dehydrogenase/Fe-S oxidoreductase